MTLGTNPAAGPADTYVPATNESQKHNLIGVGHRILKVAPRSPLVRSSGREPRSSQLEGDIDIGRGRDRACAEEDPPRSRDAACDGLRRREGDVKS